MRCPECDVELTQTLRKNITLSHCSICHGVWFSGIELVKIPRQSFGDGPDYSDSFHHDLYRHYFLPETISLEDSSDFASPFTIDDLFDFD
jgi:Zn-finger nucleic acid-binding protein